MTAALAIQHQRSRGEAALTFGKGGLSRLREQGAAKVRFLPGLAEAILINTGGGLAGGDEFRFDIRLAAGADLTVTTQTAERVYRALGPPARVTNTLHVEAGSRLAWLPQEAIIFNDAALSRNLDAELAGDAELLAIESIVFGRAAMGETVKCANLRDRWRVRQSGRLIFADDLAVHGALPATSATFGQATAMATLLLVSSAAESRLDSARALIGAAGGVSAWSGKLVARVLAKDGFELRKVLVPLLRELAGGALLPKAWSE